MDLTVLESPLREQVRAYLDVHPKSTALVTRMLEKARRRRFIRRA